MSLSKQLSSITAYKTGLHGEQCVEAFYVKMQYHKLSARFKTKAGEIDLIFVNNLQKHLIFTEVKTTLGKQTIDYQNLISKKQWQRIFAASDIFLTDAKESKADYADYTFSFDAVFVRSDKVVHRIKNIFAEDVL